MKPSKNKLNFYTLIILALTIQMGCAGESVNDRKNVTTSAATEEGFGVVDCGRTRLGDARGRGGAGGRARLESGCIEMKRKTPRRLIDTNARQAEFTTALNNLQNVPDEFDPTDMADITNPNFNDAIDFYLDLPSNSSYRNQIIRHLRYNNHHITPINWEDILEGIGSQGFSLHGSSLNLIQDPVLSQCGVGIVDVIADATGTLLDAIQAFLPPIDRDLFRFVKNHITTLVHTDKVLAAISNVEQDLINGRHGFLLLNHIGRVFLEILKAFIEDKNGVLYATTAGFLATNHENGQPFKAWTNIAKPMMMMTAQMAVWVAGSEAQIIKAMYGIAIDIFDIVVDSNSLKNSCSLSSSPNSCWPISDLALLDPEARLIKRGSVIHQCLLRLPRPANSAQYPSYNLCKMPRYWVHANWGDYIKKETRCTNLTQYEQNLFQR